MDQADCHRALSRAFPTAKICYEPILLFVENVRRKSILGFIGLIGLVGRLPHPSFIYNKEIRSSLYPQLSRRSNAPQIRSDLRPTRIAVRILVTAVVPRGGCEIASCRAELLA